MTIRLSVALTSQPPSRNSQASQSSSSGCVGQTPCEPKSSRVATSPCPKASFQSRFTNTRATSGFSGDVSQRARSSRVARRSLTPSAGREAGTSGVTTGPVSSSQLPRGKIRMTRGGTDVETRHVGTLASTSCRFFWSSLICLRTGSSRGAIVR